MEYILREKDADGKKLEPITHNLRGNTIEEWEKEYITNEAMRIQTRANAITMYHELISFHYSDRTEITKDTLQDIAQEYIKLRGQDGMYLIAPHFDKNHVHLHVMSSGVKFKTGTAHRLSRADLKELKLNLQHYHQQRFPEIKNSNPQHGKGKEYITDREYQARQRNERALHKDFVKETITACFAKAQTQKEFLTLVQKAGLHCYERNNKPQGVMYEDMKFRFSRLDIDINHLPQIHTDMKKEYQPLDELHVMRTVQETKTPERNPAPQSLTSMQLNDIRNELERLYTEKNGLFIEMTHKGLSNPKLAKDLDDIIRREAYLLSKEDELAKTLEAEKYPPKEELKQEPMSEQSMSEQSINLLVESGQIEHSLGYSENNTPDIDVNPELFDFEIEEGIDIPDEEEQELLDEFDELREEADRDEYDMDYDDGIEK